MSSWTFFPIRSRMWRLQPLQPTINVKFAAIFWAPAALQLQHECSCAGLGGHRATKAPAFIRAHTFIPHLWFYTHKWGIRALSITIQLQHTLQSTYATRLQHCCVGTMHSSFIHPSILLFGKNCRSFILSGACWLFLIIYCTEMLHVGPEGNNWAFKQQLVFQPALQSAKVLWNNMKFSSEHKLKWMTTTGVHSFARKRRQKALIWKKKRKKC